MENDSRDLQHLQLLSVFHFVLAGMMFLGGCVPFIHFFLGFLFYSGSIAHGDPAASTIGMFMMAIAAFIIVTVWALATCVAFAGYFLGKRRSYTYCLAVAALSCLVMPFGTVLGVFTIVVLMRPSVRTHFP